MHASARDKDILRQPDCQLAGKACKKKVKAVLDELTSAVQHVAKMWTEKGAVASCMEFDHSAASVYGVQLLVYEA